MPAKGHGTDRVKRKHTTRAERALSRVRSILEECVWIDYANERRSLTGQICGDPTPEHRALVERLNYERKE